MASQASRQASVINVSQLEKFFSAGDTVNPKTLAERGAVRERQVKILGDGELTKSSRSQDVWFQAVHALRLKRPAALSRPNTAMNSFLQRLTLLITDAALRNRLLFVLGALAVFPRSCSYPDPWRQRCAARSSFFKQPILWPPQPLLGRRALEPLDRDARRCAVHHRLDHHAAPHDDDPSAQAALPGRGRDRPPKV
jgi:hypothetical protein